MNTPTIRDPEKYRLALNAAVQARRRLLARLNLITHRRQEQATRASLRTEQDAWHTATVSAQMRYEPKRVSRNYYLHGLEQLI